MDKKSKRSKRSLYGAGCGYTDVDDIKEYLNAAAAAEEMDGEDKSRIFIGSNRAPLRRQSAFVEASPDRNPKLSEKAISDPYPCARTFSNFLIRDVKAVEESGDHQKVNVNMSEAEINEGQFAIGSRERRLVKSAFPDGTDSDLCSDGLSSSMDNHNILRSLSDRGPSRGKNAMSISTTSSFYITHGASINSDKPLHQNKESLSVLQYGSPITMNDSLYKMHDDLRKRAIKDRFERCDSTKTFDTSYIESLCLLKPRKFSIQRPNTAANERCSMNSKDAFSLLTDMHSQYNPEIERRLETSARCHDSTCHKCVEMRQVMKRLQDPNIPVQNLSEEEITLLMNMHVHSSYCFLSRCHFYWCDLIPKILSHAQEIVSIMKQRVENFITESFIGDAKSETFLKLHSNIKREMKEDVDWTPLIRLGHARNTILALPTHQSQQKSLEYWVIKKIVPPVEEDSQERLYECLLELKHPGIVQHLWAASFQSPEMFVVCTMYEGLSLKEVIDKQPIQSLDMVVNLMLKLTEILEHLHQAGILYLNWSSSNIMIDPSQTKVKLADFTASTLKDQVEYDIGHLDDYLPLHLHPPELLQTAGKDLDEKSDVWGLGCLLHEMVTGRPVWYQYDHATLTEFRQKMIKQRYPVVPTSMKELTVVMKSCWEFERSRRPLLNELNRLLIDISLGKQRQATSTINFFQMPRP